MSRSFRRVCVLLAVLLPLTLLTAGTAVASPESELVSRTNGERTRRGLGAYVVRSDLAAVARRQAARMAAARRLYHNPNLGSEVGGWRSIGENVGRGGSAAAIHSAFMGSSAHRANILSTRFTEVGIGSARGGDGQLYVAEVFRQPSGATYAPRTPRVAPPPTVRRTAPPRASRSAPRRALPPPTRRTAARKARVVIDPTPRRLRAAWMTYRLNRPAGSIDRAAVYVRATRILAKPE